jgi:heptaprenyl diphosphate synthase
MSGFWAEYPKVEKELAEVKAHLKNGPKTGFKDFDETLKTLFNAEGKLLRPALVCIASYLGPEAVQITAQEKRTALAASIETLHMATLVHDDIVDEAKLRRGMPSIQSQYGKDYAVYLGDFLLSRSLLLMASYGLPQDILVKLAKAVQSVCLSEIRQFECRYVYDLSLKHYLRIISGKTAALFAVSLASGAHMVEAPEKQIKIMAQIGYAIGMCFQIQDDLMDIESDKHVIKKDTLSDLEQGYMTLPILMGLRNDKSGTLRRLLEASPMDKNSIVNQLYLTGGMKGARDLAERYVERAVGHIDQLPEGETQSILKSLLPKILERIT